MELLRLSAQSCVVLLDEKPSNLFLGETAVGGIGVGICVRSLADVLVLLLLDEVAVRSHGCCVLEDI